MPSRSIVNSTRPPSRNNLELLSPAGSWECARAAIANGADAIFFGLPKHNARLRADNFTNEDLPRVMEFLHSHGARGFVTMNTLIFPDELEGAGEQLALLQKHGVDGAIIQDLGLAKLAKRVAPDVELHASTQMTITSPEGLEFATALVHLDRAVLARELSLDEIFRITNDSSGTHTPLEVFVHGALCVAYSGQCLTSESLGQRSANRGECAQACRMPYEMIVDGEPFPLGEKRYLLSPQDLAAVDIIPQLIDAGVISFKIEGRLKSPEYVAAVTRVYRKAIDAHLDRGLPVPNSLDRYQLEMTFSRGLSTGWLEGTNHPRLTHGKFGKKRGVLAGKVSNSGIGWVDIRLSSDHSLNLEAGDGIVFDAGEDRNDEQGGRIWKVDGERLRFSTQHSQIDWSRVRPGQLIWKTSDPKLDTTIRKTWSDTILDKQRVRPLLDLHVSGTPSSPLRITHAASGTTVESSCPLDKAKKRPLDKTFLTKQLGRLGDSPFALGTLDVALDDDVILPVKEINEMRRHLVDTLIKAGFPSEPIAPKLGEPVCAAIASLAPSKTSAAKATNTIQLAVLCRTPEQIKACIATDVERIYVDYEDIRRHKDAVQQVRNSAPQAKIYLATPRIQKTGEHGFFKSLANAEPDGVLVRNLGAIHHFTKVDTRFETVGDFSLNVANHLTASLLKNEAALDRLTISYDLNADQSEALIRSVPAEWLEMTLHQHMPMFHMEHCVFCTFLSEGTSFKDCGRPCETHSVQLRDRVGQLHPLKADVGCRNTLFNGRAQTGARFFDRFQNAGLHQYRIELLEEDQRAAEETILAYQELFDKQTSGARLWQDLGASEQLGVTEGTLNVL